MMVFLSDILSRLGHRHGFGIQSPWAYDFVRTVIAESLPYYDYKIIDNTLHKKSRRFRKLVKLYYRIMNRLQPKSVVDNTPTASDVLSLISLGCKNVVIRSINDPLREITVVRLSCRQIEYNGLIELYNGLYDGSMIIIEDINFSKEIKTSWKQYISQQHQGVIFDLVDTALIYVNRKMNKAIYKLYF